MNNKSVGRPVDISDININEIELWLNSEKIRRKTIICQAIISLHNGVPMKEVCNVLGVTRESVRLWKNQLRQGGLEKLLEERKVGKRSKLTPVMKEELKMDVRRSPKKHGYKEKKWSGRMIQVFVKRKWNINITVRTAYLWLGLVR